MTADSRSARLLMAVLATLVIVALLITLVPR